MLLGCSTYNPKGHWSAEDSSSRLDIIIQPDKSCLLYSGGKIEGMVASCRLVKTSDSIYVVNVLRSGKSTSTSEEYIFLEILSKKTLLLTLRGQSVTLNKVD